MTSTRENPISYAEAAELLLPGLSHVQRMALAYAPAHLRTQTLALFALDTRLAGLLRHSREPMLAQLRFAWWRETLAQEPQSWPEGEPLLRVLKSWQGHHKQLSTLVDGWEALTGAAPLPDSAIQTFARGRAEAFASLAEIAGGRDATRALALAHEWALCDLAERLTHPVERETARRLAAEHEQKRGRFSRSVRPLLVLNRLARRRMLQGDSSADKSPAAVLLALRCGLLGF